MTCTSFNTYSSDQIYWYEKSFKFLFFVCFKYLMLQLHLCTVLFPQSKSFWLRQMTSFSSLYNTDMLKMKISCHSVPCFSSQRNQWHIYMRKDTTFGRICKSVTNMKVAEGILSWFRGEIKLSICVLIPIWSPQCKRTIKHLKTS